MKSRLVSFGVGIVDGLAIFAIALLISDDMRLLYLSGAVLLATSGFLLRRLIARDWIAGVLVLLPSLVLFGYFVLPQARYLWPNLPFWAAIIALLMFHSRAGRTTTIAGVVLLVAISSWYCVSCIPTKLHRALTREANTSAPDFTLEPISQGAVPTRATSGKILVIDFFATWCSPCIAELPELERLRTDLQPNRDVQFVLVGTNSNGDTPERVRAFAQRRHISMPIAFDPDRKAQRAFGLQGFPTIVIIDRAGRVRLTHQGYNSSETDFRSDLTQLLQKL
jgi:peroxiredoxin